MTRAPLALRLGRGVVVATLAFEALLSPLLLTRSESTGVLAIFAMLVVGIAWLPGAWLIVYGQRQSAQASRGPWIVAAASGAVGAACLVVTAWLVGLSLFGGAG